MAESLRDAIGMVLHEIANGAEGDCHHEGDCRERYRPEAERVEAAALKWFADWLRSDESRQAAPWVPGREATVAALADALTRENPNE